MGRILREPILLFFVLGAVLFFGFQLLNRDQAAAITLTAGGQAVLISEWEMLTGRSAGPDDVREIIQDYYQRELLFRTGLAREIHQSDPSVRELIIELMQQQVTGDIPEPSPRDLVNFYTDHIDRYYSEAIISFSQRLYVSLPKNPQALRSALASGSAEPGEVPWQGKEFPDYGISMIRGLFGQSLLAVLQQLPLAQWQGPYESREGWHYFRVESRASPTLLPFSRVQDQVLADYQAAAVANAVSAFVHTRRREFPLDVAL